MRDIAELNEMFQDVAVLVHDQGELILLEQAWPAPFPIPTGVKNPG